MNGHLFQENYPKASAEIAGDRKYDVYMGIDVFGRGSFGGGQWTVCISILTKFIQILLFSVIFTLHINFFFLVMVVGKCCP